QPLSFAGRILGFTCSNKHKFAAVAANTTAAARRDDDTRTQAAAPAPPYYPNGNGEGRQQSPRVDKAEATARWKNAIASLCRAQYSRDPEYRKSHLTWESVVAVIWNDCLAPALQLGRSGSAAESMYQPPEGLDDKEIQQAALSVAGRAWEQFAHTERNDALLSDGHFQPEGENLPAKPDEPRFALDLVISENAEQAYLSNAEYLTRIPLVERLYYSQHISVGVGGKHEGKSNCVRTEGLAIASAAVSTEPRTIYGREITGTPVIYAASDDEYPTTRMELLRMGWNPSIPLIMVRIKSSTNENTVEPERVLEAIAMLAQREGSLFVVLDMLFDFVRIGDELKYAHTRHAIGTIQALADEIKGHVRTTHHSPKWLPDAASAAKAALGSQGIAARFSPILYSRKWTDGLYTIESTMTRDPRGQALAPTVIERDEQGWAIDKGPFKAWMKWKMYAERIVALFEGGEPGRRMSVFQM
ncbi:MAG: hypothetical protein ACRELF_19580, partial [Gemmataceae bacterium]